MPPTPSAFDDDALNALLATPDVGPQMVGYVEAIGISEMTALAAADPAILRLRINAHLGQPRLNTKGQAALAAMIATARDFLNNRPDTGRNDGTVVRFRTRD